MTLPAETPGTGPKDNPLLTIRGHVGELILNAPERKNALPLAAWQAIPEKMRLLAAEPSVRVCIVKGAGGKNFSAGADISEFEATRSTPEKAAYYDEINVAAFKALKSLPVPVIAAIEGPCLGGGLGLALACDIRIVSRTAFFGIPAARLGLAYPPEALGDLLEAVSPSDAKQLLFTGERIDADKALQIGLVNEIVDTDGLDKRIEELCATISSNAPLSLKAAKHAIGSLSAAGHAADLKDALKNARTCVDSDDYREGCRAFLEKRLPRFTGR